MSTLRQKYRKEYRTWLRMIAKCEDPAHDKYPWYGGRGITVCWSWRNSFEQFLSDMGPAPSRSHTIGRLENDLGYEPENCAWQTWKEQAQNRRTSRVVELCGTRKTIAQWADGLGVDRRVVWRRLQRGWDKVRALTTGPANPGERKAA